MDGPETGLSGNRSVHVEWRWCEGAIKGGEVGRIDREFEPDDEVTISGVLNMCQAKAAATDAAIRVPSLTHRVHRSEDMDVRWVLLHLLEETARHAGHADATRELLDTTAL